MSIEEWFPMESDLSQEERQKIREQKKQKEKRYLKKAIEHVLSVPEGRFFLSHLLRLTGVFEDVSLGASEGYIYHTLGKKQVGLHLLSLIPPECLGDLFSQIGEEDIT